jgi:outer membrane protein OmpA-like peptidoglycan-associated protein
VAKGYGETKLLNGCKQQKDCPDEQHAINRRVEVKFL